MIVEARQFAHDRAIVRFQDGTTVERDGDVTKTTFTGDLSCSNWPPESEEYRSTAEWLGFTDLGRYNFEHEVCHVLVPRALFNERGYVSWMAAQNRTMSVAAAKAEERLIWLVQATAAGKIACPHGCEPAVEALWKVQTGLEMQDAA